MFIDLEDFGPEDETAVQNNKQSMTFGSKMNHDNMRKLGGGFDNESGEYSEPPFA
jgi:hypothetical protein